MAGSVALAGGGLASGALPVLTLRPHADAGLIVVYFGLIVLISAWWALGKALPSSESWLRRTLLLWLLPLALGPPLFSRDVYSYLAQGAMVVAGIDVYRFGPSHLGGPLADQVPMIWRDTPAPYGPVFLRIAAAVAQVAQSDVIAGVAGLRVVALAGLGLLVFFLPRLARICQVDPAAALWLGALNPLVLLHFVAGAHNDAVMMGLLVAGLAVAARYPIPGAVLVALAGLVKAPAALGLLAVAWCWADPAGIRVKAASDQASHQGKAVARLWPGSAGSRVKAVAGTAFTRLWAGSAGRRVKAVLGTASVALATGVAATFAAGTGYGWMSALDTPVSASNWSLSSAIGRLTGEVLRSLGSDLAALAVPTWRWIGIAAAAATALVAWHRHSPVYALGLSLAGFALLGPATRPWYLLWGLIPIAAAAPPGAARRYCAALCAILAIVVLPDGYPPTVAQLGLAAAGSALAAVTLWRAGVRWPA
ncbi:hypothetical protein Rhe02_66480 [Rhizocola hellebori]|uniref:DUF2029 domain-containing protein n=1 Tax=Rhizocola hellebori TaxID=1392758 RepID=A0A8J3QDB3_9ACTN|nr:hypothetical protein Rhe02_66480 [Rhizocola hellebori]